MRTILGVVLILAGILLLSLACLETGLLPPAWGQG